MKVYLLVKDNFEGDVEVDVYATEEQARKALSDIEKKYRKAQEFRTFENGCSWWDGNYNEYSTCITLVEKEIL